ncbi:MAG TPA: PLP-dependent aminotransferase family protein [Oculatellaceae cyanobacterium]
MDFPINLDTTIVTPLWKQLCNELNRSIMSGRLEAGAPLPPTRQLATMLNVSRDTVVRAYNELALAGRVESFVGIGTFVSNNKLAPPTERPTSESRNTEQTRKWLSDYGLLHSIEVAPSSSQIRNSLLHSWSIASEELPMHSWRESWQLKRPMPGSDSAPWAKIAERFGLQSIREALADYLKRSKAVQCSEEQIAVFSDWQQALNLAARLLVNPGDGILIEEPSSPVVRQQFLLQGANLYPIPVDDDGLITDQLEQYSGKCKIAYVTPAHHALSGAVMSQSRRVQFLAWARQNNVLIIEDALDSDYRYASQSMVSLQGLDNTGSVLYLYSFSKTLHPLTALACMVIPEELSGVFETAGTLTRNQYPLLEHSSVANFLLAGHMDRHLRKSRETLLRRRQSLIFALVQGFKTRVNCGKESAGMHLRTRFASEISPEHLLQAAQKVDLPLYSTREYYLTTPPCGEFLMPFATLTDAEERVSEFISVLEALAKEERDGLSSNLDFSPASSIDSRLTDNHAFSDGTLS